MNHNNFDFDPAAYRALFELENAIKKSEPYRPLVFVCSPFAGDVEQNIENAQKYCRFAVDNGAIPFAPHLLYPSFMRDAVLKERTLGLFFGLVWLGKCQELWVFGEQISNGMAIEIAKAKQLKRIRIRYFNTECQELRLEHDKECRTQHTT